MRKFASLLLGAFLFGALTVAAPGMTLWDLASRSPQEYHDIFLNKCVTPTLKDFRGHKLNGLILDIANWGLGKRVYFLYTGKMLDALTGKLYSQQLTFQKRFYPADNERGESGINFWPVRGHESMPMKIYLSPAIDNPALDSLKIDYAVPGNNPVTEQILVDEVRQIPGSPLYLGKMYYREFGRHLFFLWFALEKAD